MIHSLFVPGTICFLERKFQYGQFVPWNFRSLALSLPGFFIPCNFRSRSEMAGELSFSGTFVLKSIHSQELLLPEPVSISCTGTTVATRSPTELQLRKRPHSRQIPNCCSYLTDCNFLTRMLFADTY